MYIDQDVEYAGPRREEEKRRRRRQAAANYDWMEPLYEWAKDSWTRMTLVTVFVAIVKPLAIAFWENIFATIVSILVLVYAAINRSHFTPISTAVVVSVVILFQLPLIYFVVSATYGIITISEATTDAKVEAAVDNMEETMEDMQKSLQLGSICIMVLVSLVFAFMFFMR